MKIELTIMSAVSSTCCSQLLPVTSVECDWESRAGYPVNPDPEELLKPATYPPAKEPAPATDDDSPPARVTADVSQLMWSGHRRGFRATRRGEQALEVFLWSNHATKTPLV